MRRAAGAFVEWRVVLVVYPDDKTGLYDGMMVDGSIQKTPWSPWSVSCNKAQLGHIIPGLGLFVAAAGWV